MIIRSGAAAGSWPHARTSACHVGEEKETDWLQRLCQTRSRNCTFLDADYIETKAFECCNQLLALGC